MWVKHLANGTKVVEGANRTWLTTNLDSIIRVDLILPQQIFKKNYRFTLSGPGPYHQAVKARATVGGKSIKISEYVQRYDGKNWLTVEADYITGVVKQYILKDRIGSK